MDYSVEISSKNVFIGEGNDKTYAFIGNLVSLEIMDASQRISQTRKIEFETTEYQTGIAAQ